MFYIISRPPTDDFTFRLLYQILSKIDVKKSTKCFYAHSYHLETHYYEDKCTFHPLNKNKEYQDLSTGDKNRDFLESQIDAEQILLVIKDHLSGDKKHTDDPLWLLEYIRFLIYQYPNKHFILSTSLENLKQYFKEPNISVIHHGGDIVNQYYDYKKIIPIFNKNFDSIKPAISLNRNFRFQRFIFLSLLMNLNLEKYFQLSCMFEKQLDTIDIKSNFKNFKFIEKIIAGNKKLKKYKFDINHDYLIYKTSSNDNVSNFKNQLTDLYKNSFIEVAMETTFLEDCFLITEKTANVFLACNFPIILNSKYSIDFLRKIGFDMFDDIIDHSYDLIDDPVERVYIALTNNKKLLTDVDLIKKLWKLNSKRFQHNVFVLQNKLHNFYASRFESELIRALK